MIAAICRVLLPWEIEIRKQYPFLDTKGRALNIKSVNSDSISDTPFDVYLKGELSVYSLRTLTLYLHFITKMSHNQQNGTEQIYTNMMKLHGFADLSAAQAHFDGSKQ